MSNPPLSTQGGADREVLRTLIDALPDSIYVKDAHGHYILDNLAHMHHIGLSSPDEVVGKTVFDFFPKNIADRFYADDEAILRSGTPLLNREEAIIDHDGTKRWISTTKVPFRNVEGEISGIVCLSRDVSEEKRAKEDLLHAMNGLKKAHEDLRAVQIELVEAEKMKSIGRLAAGVAHEVKNPLAIISMGVDYLAQVEFGKNATVAEIIQQVASAVQRADHVVREMLDFSAPKKLTLADHSLNVVVEEALTMTGQLFAEKAIKVVRELSAGLPPVQMDPVKIGQVLVNLITNAADAVPKSGGTITVRTYSNKLANFGASVGDSRQELFRAGDTIVVVEIQDNGPGVPADQLEKIFDPFFTTKPTGQGTGLGLTVSKTIMDLHNASLVLSNANGGGAVASMTFHAST